MHEDQPNSSLERSFTLMYNYSLGCVHQLYCKQVDHYLIGDHNKSFTVLRFVKVNYVVAVLPQIFTVQKLRFH